MCVGFMGAWGYMLWISWPNLETSTGKFCDNGTEHTSNSIIVPALFNLPMGGASYTIQCHNLHVLSGFFLLQKYSLLTFTIWLTVFKASWRRRRASFKHISKVSVFHLLVLIMKLIIRDTTRKADHNISRHRLQNPLTFPFYPCTHHPVLVSRTLYLCTFHPTPMTLVHLILSSTSLQNPLSLHLPSYPHDAWSVSFPLTLIIQCWSTIPVHLIQILALIIFIVPCWSTIPIHLILQVCHHQS